MAQLVARTTGHVFLDHVKVLGWLEAAQWLFRSGYEVRTYLGHPATIGSETTTFDSNPVILGFDHIRCMGLVNRGLDI